MPCWRLRKQSNCCVSVGVGRTRVDPTQAKQPDHSDLCCGIADFEDIAPDA